MRWLERSVALLTVYRTPGAKMSVKGTCDARSLRSSRCLAIFAAALGVALTLPFGGLAVADDAQLLANCPIVGDTADPRVRALNTLKRRMTLPTPADIDPRVTLKALVAPGDDNNRWDDKRGATIEGFVADVKVGGVESVNCHTRDPAFRDTHVELTLDPMANDETTYVIVEVTPQFRQKNGAARSRLEHQNATQHPARALGTNWRLAYVRRRAQAQCQKHRIRWRSHLASNSVGSASHHIDTSAARETTVTEHESIKWARAARGIAA